ncbi:MAG: sn-glycerol-3-phosphate ABC transporter ATP-binding protein UgpC [Thermoleophilia bacterium]|nr:sn-glycerol-3-phosphate ABC transporter ATP-binding protein UgpC [Thermoleophilia bacterium]
MAQVTIEHLGKTFSEGTEAVRDLSLEIGDGELVVLVGPSGCGKTTTLRMVAGLEETTSGTITIGDRVVNHLPPRERDIAMVFQNYALYPHKTVYENLAFPLKLRRLSKPEIDDRVRRSARLLGLEDLLGRKPRQLSGGQRQRVAMGRAIVREPQAFLMDEPLSNLDAKLRTQMRAEIHRLQRELQATTIYVTHDQVEAMTLGDRVALLRKGELQQMATPQELYDKPTNVFVAGFIGSPAMNFVGAELGRRDGHLEVTFGQQSLRLHESEARPGLEAYIGRRCVLGIRPEHLEDAALESGAPADRRFRGKVEVREGLGSEVVVHFQVEAPPTLTEDVRELALDVDAAALADLEREQQLHETVFVGRFGASTKAAEGDAVEVVAEHGALHFFDAESGRRISL